MSQVARNLNDAEEGFLVGKRYLIHDRDPLFTAEFLGTLGTSGVQSVKLSPRSPNLNAHAERFVRTIKESCLERMILFGEGSLRKAIHEFVEHYHRERNHQGLGNRLIMEDEFHADRTGAIQCRQRLGGMLNYLPRGIPGAAKILGFRGPPRCNHKLAFTEYNHKIGSAAILSL
jgi:putative transposase